MKRFLLATVTVALALTLVGGAAFAEDGTTSTSNSDGSTTTTTTSTTHADSGDTVTTNETTVYPCSGGQQTTVTNTTVQGPESGSENSSSSSQACGEDAGKEKPGFALAIDTYAYGVSGTGIDLGVIGDPTPTGSVRVILDGRTLKTVTLDSTGSAFISMPRTLSAGHHLADLAYSGDASNAPALWSQGKGGPMWSPLNVDIARAQTATSIAVPKSVSKTRYATVRVRSLESGLRPTGTVKIYVGGHRVRTVALRPSAHGNLTIRLPKLKSGKKQIRAVYSPDRNHEGSKSAVKKINVKR